jgi:lipid-binding SYLF domain-containing protein
MWSKTKTQSKVGFDKVYTWVDKLGAPVNRLSNKVGSEAFWPTTLDIESDKAARILKSFCKDGFYTDQDRPSNDGPKATQKVLKKIPSDVIKNAKGLCIFTTMRTGLWMSGSGGAGIIVARTPDGSWSPPSGIMMHTVGIGFLVGVDIYDCVIVINSQKALDAFQSVRCTLGGEISAVAGPVGIGGMVDTELHKRQAPLFTYIKSRGFYAGLQLDGTIVIERTDENERFYGERIGVKDILTGKVRHPPYELRRLMETLKSAQGDSDADESLIPEGAPPADFEVTAPANSEPEPLEEKPFGIPDTEDPDPYGVLALQSAGLEIREAGTHNVPDSEQFEFKPSPTSPIFSTFRKSTDIRSSFTISRPSSWRTSTLSSMLGSRPPSTMVASRPPSTLVSPRSPSTMVDMSTQTDLEPPTPLLKSPQLPPRHSPTAARTPSPQLANIPETSVQEATPRATEIVEEAAEEAVQEATEEPTATQLRRASTGFSDDADLDEDLQEEEPVIHVIHQAAAPQFISRARVVQVAKPVAPKLPPRNPFRNRSSVNSEASTEADVSTGTIGEKHTPSSTPSLRHGYSTSSLSSVEGEGLSRVSEKLRPKSPTQLTKQEDENRQEKDDSFNVPLESPVKTIPGGFI